MKTKPLIFIILAILVLPIISAPEIEISHHGNSNNPHVELEIPESPEGNLSFNQSLADSIYLKLDASNDPLTGELTTEDIVPRAGGDRDIGESLNPFDKGYFKTVSINTVFSVIGTISSNLIPTTDNERILGEKTTPRRWAGVYSYDGDFVDSVIIGDNLTVEDNISALKIYQGHLILS